LRLEQPMGLDMYLEAEQYISEYDEQNNLLFESIKEIDPHGLGGFQPKSIRFELAYWRKANAIHNWFVQNVQEGKDECQTSHVSLEQLKELKETCEKVLNDMDLASDLLPVARGFFFGNYEYDEYYERHLERTVENLNKIVSHPKAEKWWITYTASW
jgi:hypothetical protein